MFILKAFRLFERVNVILGMELLCRADTSRTMVSRQNSTSELSRGLSHILLDANSGALPDDLQQLEDHSMPTILKNIRTLRNTGYF
jgi:sulfur transfer protein SufE